VRTGNPPQTPFGSPCDIEEMALELARLADGRSSPSSVSASTHGHDGADAAGVAVHLLGKPHGRRVGRRHFMSDDPLRQIAASLNQRGIPTSRGGPWSAVQVKRVLDRGDG
jgi:Recombinase